MARPILHPDRLPTGRLARISVDQYHRMIESGSLRESAPVELLDGLLIQKNRSAKGEDAMTVGKRHAVAVHRLLMLDSVLAALGWHMRVQNPVTFVPSHEPEPDGAIARGYDAAYLDRHPSAEDLACVIEVADSSLEDDRTLKLAVYARAGVRLYVIVNLVGNQVEVHEHPDVDSATYAQTRTLLPGETLTISLPEGGQIEIPVRELIP